jgi:hypothetical protein
MPETLLVPDPLLPLEQGVSFPAIEHLESSLPLVAVPVARAVLTPPQASIWDVLGTLRTFAPVSPSGAVIATAAATAAAAALRFAAHKGVRACTSALAG